MKIAMYANGLSSRCQKNIPRMLIELIWQSKHRRAQSQAWMEIANQISQLPRYQTCASIVAHVKMKTRSSWYAAILTVLTSSIMSCAWKRARLQLRSKRTEHAGTAHLACAEAASRPRMMNGQSCVMAVMMLITYTAWIHRGMLSQKVRGTAHFVVRESRWMRCRSMRSRSWRL